MIGSGHVHAARLTAGRLGALPVVLGLVILLAGCGDPTSGDTTTGGAYESSVVACEDQGLVAVEGEGCLSPAEIEEWKTADCFELTFDECRDLGFPEPWAVDGGVSGTEPSQSPSGFLEKWGQTADSAPPQPETSMGSGSGGWECSYSPTYDYDWHNDIYCTDGVDSDRPYLLAGDNYITESEIRVAAREHEDMLNSR